MLKRFVKASCYRKGGKLEKIKSIGMAWHALFTPFSVCRNKFLSPTKAVLTKINDLKIKFKLLIFESLLHRKHSVKTATYKCFKTSLLILKI